MRYLLTASVALMVGATVFAQSQNFKLGKWTEIQNAVLKELSRSYVDTLPVDRIERAGIDAMLSSLDPYTVYIPEEENEDLQMMINKTYGGIGAVIFKPEINGNVIINEPYAGSPAVKAGLRCGDEILTIDGVSTHGLTSQQSSERMRGKPGTQVQFKVVKVYAKDTVEVVVTRERIHLPDVEYAGMLSDGKTGYIYQSGFTENVSLAVKEAFLKLKGQGMEKLVLDLRGNGGGLMSEAVSIVSLFVPKGSLVVSCKGMAPGTSREYRTSTEPLDTEIPIIVLVDSGTASSSEIVSGALQDLDRATIMGERTYGKGLVQSIRPLPYNGQMKVTTAKYYTPSGRCVQAIDYSHRNENGSVGHIPDSLTHEFKTANGRTVRDGGGITPDVKLKSKDYSRLVYSLVVNGIINEYALKYVSEHKSADRDFHLSDKEYADFVSFAKEKKFDYRSSAQTYFDQMKKELEKDGLSDGAKSQLDALQKAIDMDKETFLNVKKAEIVPFIEEEIVVRYYLQEAGIGVRLRYDDELKEALTKPLISLK
ncbi:MAG: S41 family peptidase [Bacteroidales bacterium]|nr:S41 family peptidase [Bacteroidales bacterium]MDY6001537.1 S41 family peptidase [Candidatus Cryptobacteroides sp.]